MHANQKANVDSSQTSLFLKGAQQNNAVTYVPNQRAACVAEVMGGSSPLSLLSVIRSA
jgi:hypothetical protein